MNIKGDLSESFAKVTISFNGLSKTKEAARVRGYLSAVDNTIHFGLGNSEIIDRLKVVWPSGKVQELQNINANSTITLIESEANDTDSIIAKPEQWLKRSNPIEFTHKENEFNDFFKEVLLPYKQSTLGPCITKGDINGDGKDDLFIGGALGQSAQIFIQNESGFMVQSNPILESDRWLDYLLLITHQFSRH